MSFFCAFEHKLTLLQLPLSRPSHEDYEIDTVLRSTLTDALDHNVFCTIDSVEKDLSKWDLESPFVLVVDQGECPKDLSGRHLISLVNATSLAVVDRTADVEEAARLITRARLSFGGSSSYGPDLVLVNEFVKDKFLDACSRFSDREVIFHEVEVQRRYDPNHGPGPLLFLLTIYLKENPTSESKRLGLIRSTCLPALASWM